MTRPYATALGAVRHCPLFAGLPDPDLAALAEIGVAMRHEPGAELFFEGDPATGLHVVMEGAVRVYKIHPSSGREMILTVERPGQAVAELPSLDGGKYPANASAMVPTTTLFLPIDRLEALMLARPHLTRHLLRGVGARLRLLVGLVESLSFHLVVGRLCAYLLERADTDGLPFQLETNAMIAARIGTVGELVTRNLSRLAASGVIHTEGRKVLAVDRAALEEQANE
ncbi:MAG TPA: Crp/Fnr family transcriptional regulator [Deinococcales bacterium]|nr:Crp/Fnr family transcriptional regulator [Deinococcales bacterium]